MSSQHTFMCKDLLEAATYGRENTLTQLLGLNEGGSLDSALVTIEAPNNPPNQTEYIQSATRMGNTVLHILASNGHAELAQKTYMKDRSLLEVCNKGGETALHCAARYGHSGVISLLVDKALELEHDFKDTLRKKNMHGETALHEAARHGHTAIVRTLITQDPELAGQVNKNNESPLYLATIERHVSVVQLFVQYLCDREINFTYYSGPKRTTALHAAALRSKNGLAEYIIRIPLHLCSLKFFRMPQKEAPGLDMANELLKLEFGTLAKIADIFGSTPLHYAASTGDTRMAQKLLNHNNSLAYCDDSHGLFPVHVAAYMGHLETLITLLENNLDSWELLDQRGRNFLHVGAEGESYIIFHLIRAAKSRYAWKNLGDVLRKASCAKDNEGNTPLHIAARCGDRCAVNSLLQKEWVHFTLTSLDNLALSNGTITTESYEEIYQHYKTQQLVGEAERSPRKWLLSYINEQKPPETSENFTTKIQTLALGSVLIATGTFAAAFTLPGGYYSSDGTPVLGKKYAFRAFILANFAAFASSFGCTFYLIFIGTTTDRRWNQINKMYKAHYLFTMASISMGLAFALGLYVVLSPVSKGFSSFILLTALLAALRFRYNRSKMLKWVLTWVAPFFVIFLFAFIK